MGSTVGGLCYPRRSVCVRQSVQPAAFRTCVCVCVRQCDSWIRTQPCYGPDLQADPAAAASLGLGWRDHLGPFLAGHIGWGGRIPGLLDLVSPLTPLVRRATTQWDLENRVGMEIGEGPEKAKCASLKTLCGGRWQSPWAQIITFALFWRGPARDRSASTQENKKCSDNSFKFP